MSSRSPASAVNGDVRMSERPNRIWLDEIVRTLRSRLTKRAIVDGYGRPDSPAFRLALAYVSGHTHHRDRFTGAQLSLVIRLGAAINADAVHGGHGWRLERGLVELEDAMAATVIAYYMYAAASKPPARKMSR